MLNFSKCMALAWVILISLLIPGCSTDKLPEPSQLPPQLYHTKLKLRFDINEFAYNDYPQSFIPALDEQGAIFSVDHKGNILKVDSTDGTVISHFKLKRLLSSGTALSSSLIFVTTMDAEILALDKANAEVVWYEKLPNLALEAPQVTSNSVIVRTIDGQLLSYKINNGQPLWVYQKQIPLLSLRAYNTFQIVGEDVIMAGFPTGRLALINLINGLQIWENSVALPEGATDIDKLTDIAMRPALDNKEICVATFNGKIACLDALSSNTIWSKKFSSSKGIITDEQNIYVVGDEGFIYAFDKATGAEIWVNKSLQYRNLSTPAFIDNNILVVDEEGNLCLIDKVSGKLIAIQESNLKGGVAMPLAIDSNKAIVLQSANGHLVKIMPL